MPARTVFMGTPEFACPALRALAASPDVELALVVTQPDRAAGRGRKLVSPPVKVVASEIGLPVYQTASLRTAEQRRPIVEAAPDLIVVAAFGLILGRSILDLPPLGCINLHASLLPAYRGASPISAAIATGDAATGVTLMQMERGLDTGPMLARAMLVINPVDTTESLTSRLATVAAELLSSSLGPLLGGNLPGEPQGPGASLTRPLTKADGWLDWERPAMELERHVRAMWAWPRAWTTLASGETLQVHQSHVAKSPAALGEPGTIANHGSDLAVQTGAGLLIIDLGQLPGGKPLPGPLLLQRLAGKPDALGRSGRPAPGAPLVTPVEH